MTTRVHACECYASLLLVADCGPKYKNSEARLSRSLERNGASMAAEVVSTQALRSSGRLLFFELEPQGGVKKLAGGHLLYVDSGKKRKTGVLLYLRCMSKPRLHHLLASHSICKPFMMLVC